MDSFLLILLIVVIGYGIWAYNNFVRLINRTKEAWADIDVQLKRRYDLIPNLVNTVQGYAKHEKGVFLEVTKARTALMGARGVEKKAEANNMLTDALKSLFAVAENYPTLRASENFKHLQEELSDTENKIAYSRQFYNSNVMVYNTKIATFPTMFVAQAFNFKSDEFFAANEEERKAVKVTF